MAESFEERHADSAEQDDGPYAKWPPEPPIGRLPAEKLHLRSVGSEAEKKYLYLLLRGRYGLTREDLFREVPNKVVWDERMMLKAFILSLEGWPDAKIEQELNNGYGGLDVQRNRYATKGYSELIKIMKHRTIRWHSLLMPETAKRPRERYSAAENMSAIEKAFADYLESKYPGEHRSFPRTKIFSYENTFLPTPHGTGFANTDNVLLILRRRIADRQTPAQIAESIGHRIAEEKEGGAGNTDLPRTIINVTHSVLSREAREMLKEMGILQQKRTMERKRREKTVWPDERRALAAVELAKPGTRYRDVERTMGIKKDTLHSFIPYQGREILRAARESQDPVWAPWLEHLTTVAAFLVKYGGMGFEEAIARAQEIRGFRKG